MDEHTNSNTANIRQPVIKVLGLGGGGSNAVNRMIELGLKGVDFAAANTDVQALESCLAHTKIRLGPTLTRGLGAGGDPEIGRRAAEESRVALSSALAGADMVFLTAGMGGGTGTGAIPIAAEIARHQGAVTIAVVTTPFAFEMGRRQSNAAQGLDRLRPHTNTLIAIPNDRLLYVAPRDLPMEVAFRMADDVLRQSVQAIAELVTEPGLINVDFAHIRQVMKLGGGALMAIGQGSGEEKVAKAIHQALNHPLLESVTLEQAAGVIVNFSGGDDLSLYEVSDGVAQLQEMAGEDVEIIMGVINDSRLQGRAQVIMVITGLGAQTLDEVIPEPIAEPLPAKHIPVEPVTAEPFPEDEDDEEQPALIEFPDSLLEIVPPAAQDLDMPAFLRKRVRLREEALEPPTSHVGVE